MSPDPETSEPLAGLIRRILTEAGHTAAVRAGYGAREGGGNVVRAGFTIEARVTSAEPYTPDVNTMIVAHERRYDANWPNNPGGYSESRDAIAGYAAVLHAVGLDVQGSGPLVVRRKDSV
jgi:hypothetical protein